MLPADEAQCGEEVREHLMVNELPSSKHRPKVLEHISDLGSPGAGPRTDPMVEVLGLIRR